MKGNLYLDDFCVLSTTLLLALGSRVYASWSDIVEYPLRPLVGYMVFQPYVSIPIHAIALSTLLAYLAFIKVRRSGEVRDGASLIRALRGALHRLGGNTAIACSFMYAVIMRVISTGNSPMALPCWLRHS